MGINKNNRYKKGDFVRHDDLNEILRRLAQGNNLKAAAPLQVAVGPYGQHLSIDLPQPYDPWWVTITGNDLSSRIDGDDSPILYSWEKLLPVDGLLTDDTITGTENAIEISNRYVPIGTRVRLWSIGFDDVGEPRYMCDAGQLELRAKLEEALHPGSNADAIFQYWDGDSWEDGDEVTITDPRHNCFGLENEIIYCQHWGNAYEVCRPHGLVRIAKADEDIAINSTGTVNVWAGGAEADTTIDVTADHTWMDGGEQIDEGTEIVIQYFPDATQWRIVNAECA